ncbi:MAG: alpha-amylase family glycosyl hydrolase [Acidimicrobiales bacterium]
MSLLGHGVVGYSLYLRSFADTNGNGEGDLRGVIDHLDHLRGLGVGLVWIAPFYPSPMVDGGYDVIDHCGVDARFGTLDDVDELLDSAHSLGMAVVVDLIANHTSNQHPWFIAARASRSNPWHDHYVWADPSDDGGPPNNWVSYFGGPAWTYEPSVGQYYLHLFHAEQPDLNWRHAEVRREYERILRFWLDRGVDGFRVDVAQGLVKDEHLRSNPQTRSLDPGDDRIRQWQAFEHDRDILQPETRDIFRRWKQICDEYGAILIGEVSVDDPERFARLLGDGGLDLGLWLEPMHVPWSAHELRRVLGAPVQLTTNHNSIGWQVSSLDEPRAVSRFGGGERGRRRALALSTLMAFLPGVPFIYQGDELGLEQGRIDPGDRVDRVGGEPSAGRDGCRTPMPWNTGPMAGFTGGSQMWLPFSADAPSRSVASQTGQTASSLERHRSLLAARRHHCPDPNTAVEWLDDLMPSLLGFRRGELTVIVNMADEPTTIALSGKIVFDSQGSAGPDVLTTSDTDVNLVHLSEAQAVVVRSWRSSHSGPAGYE